MVAMKPGKTAVVRLTGPVNPLMLVTLMSFDAHAPMKIVRLDGFVVIVKSGEVGSVAIR